MIVIDDKYMEEMFKKDPQFKKGYDALEDKYNLIGTFMEMKYESGLTQEEIAKKMGTSQPAISRFMLCNIMPSMKMILRYAKATDCKVKLTYEKSNKAISPKHKKNKLASPLKRASYHNPHHEEARP